MTRISAISAATLKYSVFYLHHLLPLYLCHCLVQQTTCVHVVDGSIQGDTHGLTRWQDVAGAAMLLGGGKGHTTGHERKTGAFVYVITDEYVSCVYTRVGVCMCVCVCVYCV